MANTSTFIKRINDYKKCMRFFDCANYIFLDEIDNFEFRRISKYSKSKYIYQKIKKGFELVNELLEREDITNAATILRTVYENIMYIIATTYNTSMKITLDTVPSDYRHEIEKKYDIIFTDYFEETDFNNIYKYLCKIVHPCSMKEFVSYINKTTKYKIYILCNLKYIMLVIEFLYLNFLNKKLNSNYSEFDLNFIDLCSYVNLINILYFMNDIKNSKNFIKRYFFYDTNNKYIKYNNNEIKQVYEELVGKEVMIEKNINEITKNLDEQIKNSRYKDIIEKMLSENKKTLVNPSDV